MAFEHAIRVQPDYVKARYHLGIVSIWRAEFDRALSCLGASAQAKHDHGRRMTETLVSKSRLRHDAEQIQYLFDRALLGEAYAVYRNALKRLDQQAREDASAATCIHVDQRDLDLVAPSFNRVLHRAACERVPEGTATSARSWATALPPLCFCRSPKNDGSRSRASRAARSHPGLGVQIRQPAARAQRARGCGRRQRELLDHTGRSQSGFQDGRAGRVEQRSDPRLELQGI